MTTANIISEIAPLQVLKYNTADEAVIAAQNTLRTKFASEAEAAAALASASKRMGGTSVQPDVIDLTPRVSSVSTSEVNQFAGGNAVITLIMYPDEYSEYVANSVPVNINQAKGFKGYKSLVKLGDFVQVIRGGNPVFFGVITSFTTRREIQADGHEATLITLGCASFMHLYVVSQLRMTPVGDNYAGAPQLTDILTTIETGALAQYGDYRDGFLKSVISAIEKQGGYISLAQFLQRVITALGHYKLPAALGGGTLGENIVVLDGSTKDFAQFAPSAALGTGNDADVLRATTVSKFRAMTMSNMTHAEIINSIFMPLTQMIELFPLVLPARTRRTRKIERAAGITLALVYRFKPCTPQNGPSVSSYLSQLLRKGATSKAYSAGNTTTPGGSSFCPAYFGPTIVNGSYYRSIDRSNVASIDITMQDNEHVNAVFLEMPWGKGDAHNGNLIRSSAPLVCDVADINRYGLRCVSASHPFYSPAESTPQQTIDWELSGRALPERLFHTIAMNNEFFSGVITLFQADPMIRPGMWLQVADTSFLGFEARLDDPNSMLCYVNSVAVSTAVDVNGIASQLQTIEFARGSYGVNIPVPHQLDGPTSTVKNLRATPNTDWELT